MRTIVSVQEISEFDIRPASVLIRWRELVEAEIMQRWGDRSGWIHVDCPTCSQKDAIPAFDRYGIAYVECPACGSLYARLRPSEAQLWSWYRESTPARFWREKILPATREARREKITRPRANWVLDGIAEYVPSARRLVDISQHGRGLVDLLTAENSGLVDVVAAGMTADLEMFSNSRVQVYPTPIVDLPSHGPADIVVAVDVLDRSTDMGAVVAAIENLLAPGGVVFATAPVASGFEVQTLWERSLTVIPPDKLNLPTVAGLQQIFAAPVWELLELSTPGMFDVEMVRRAMKAEPDAIWPRVVRALVERTNDIGRMALVELLQSQRLTSFARLVARRRI
jgi:hypothetical protein